MRPRAAATNSDRAGSARPSAPASRTAVSWRAVRLMPRSRSLTDRGLTPAALASSCCVSPAPARNCRSNPANPEVASSTAAPSHHPQPRQRQKAPHGQGPCPRLSRPGARATSPGTGTGQPAPRARSGRPGRSPGPARRYRPPARSCPACPVHAARRRHPVGLLCAARVRITPGHGHTRTNGSPGGPGGLRRPGQNRSSDPCPRAYPGGEALMGGQNPPRSRGPWRKVQQRDRPPLPGRRTRLPRQGSRRSRRYGRPARRERCRPSGVNR